MNWRRCYRRRRRLGPRPDSYVLFRLMHARRLTSGVHPLRTLLPIEWATLTRASVAHGLSQMPISFGPEPDRQARLALA